MAIAEEPWKNNLKRAVSQWEVILTDEILGYFSVYLRELERGNKTMNLTSLKDPVEIALGHFADSLSPLQIDAVIEAKTARALDIGSGAGFPGLPLKIVKSGWRMTLLDSVKKKCRFLQSLVNAMEISHVEIICKRSEELGWDPSHREAYDFVFSRALTNFSTLVEYSLPFLKVGGCLIAHRGKTAQEETSPSRIQNALNELGGQLVNLLPYTIHGMGGERALVIVRKIRPTSIRYPRRIGVAAKRPL